MQEVGMLFVKLQEWGNESVNAEVDGGTNVTFLIARLFAICQSGSVGSSCWPGEAENKIGLIVCC